MAALDQGSSGGSGLHFEMQPMRFEVENKQALQPGKATGSASVFSSAVNIAKQQAGVVFLTYADAVNKAGSLVWCLVLLGVAVSMRRRINK